MGNFHKLLFWYLGKSWHLTFRYLGFEWEGNQTLTRLVFASFSNCIEHFMYLKEWAYYIIRVYYFCAIRISVIICSVSTSRHEKIHYAPSHWGFKLVVSMSIWMSFYWRLLSHVTFWTWWLLGRSLMIGWSIKSWNPERVPTVVTLSVCPSVCPWTTYRAHLLT